MGNLARGVGSVITFGEISGRMRARARTFDEVVREVRDEVHGHVDRGVEDIAGEVEEAHGGGSGVRAACANPTEGLGLNRAKKVLRGVTTIPKSRHPGQQQARAFPVFDAYL